MGDHGKLGAAELIGPSAAFVYHSSRYLPTGVITVITVFVKGKSRVTMLTYLAADLDRCNSRCLIDRQLSYMSPDAYIVRTVSHELLTSCKWSCQCRRVCVGFINLAILSNTACWLRRVSRSMHAAYILCILACLWRLATPFFVVTRYKKCILLPSISQV